MSVREVDVVVWEEIGDFEMEGFRVCFETLIVSMDASGFSRVCVVELRNWGLGLLRKGCILRENWRVLVWNLGRGLKGFEIIDDFDYPTVNSYRYLRYMSSEFGIWNLQEDLYMVCHMINREIIRGERAEESKAERGLYKRVWCVERKMPFIITSPTRFFLFFLCFR